MGKYYYDQENFDYACVWIYQAIHWLQSDKVLPLPIDLDRAEVLHVYAEALVKMSKSNPILSVFCLSSIGSSLQIAIATP